MSSVSIPNLFTLAHESSGVPASDCHPQRGGFGPPQSFGWDGYEVHLGLGVLGRGLLGCGVHYLGALQTK